MKIKILFSILLLTHFTGFSQQDSQFTQYMYNTINVNPAYAGSRGFLSIFGLHRSQWIGVDGAPETNSFSINSPIFGQLGIGLSFINDRIGPTEENTISADISYTIQTSENYKLSFGIKGTGNFFNLDAGKLNPADAGDLKFQNLKNNFTPNFGAGVYVHSKKFYAGISVPNFFEKTRYNDNSVSVHEEKMNFYFISGYVFDLNSNLKFKPAFLVKTIEGSPLQADISGNFLLYDKFMLGAAYRWDAAVSALAGFQITEGLFIGYGYDAETTRLRKYNSGSHEIFLRFDIFSRYDRITSPRFF
ncbi:type IX secretion system membrane protein PorP/SprF [uncultured Flavobacterium sp.]|uniref:PorP/SprF family type IX secretion system membrane protein n=1 Tax=uncultured Flavobacterium sp. TaxID=165435 RepID=UPI0025FCBD37|nr:type IX secretion system membrane protein PorP/SprF [uncultured Flavobacterium sp.]